MLSDEEKQAIESLIEIREFANLSNYKDTKISQLNAIDIVLNLIEKQSKEIEEHIENKELINQTLGLEKNANINKTLEKIIILNNFEDKIKAKLEEIMEEKEHYLEMNDEYNAQICDCIIEEYESLLEKE